MINIYDNLNRNLYLITSLKNEGSEVTMSAKEIQSYNELFSESLTSGEMYGDFILSGGLLQSSNFVTGSTGWQLTPTSSEFPSITVSGGTIKYQKTAFTDTVNAGYHISSSGFYFGSANDASYIKYNIGTTAFNYVGNVSDRASSVLAGAIDASGDLINDIINARLDSSSKKILSDFNFGSTNYAGAVKSGDITWNTTTGAITGGSGVVVYRGGIIAANAGVATITLDATTGGATFAGDIIGGTLNINNNAVIDSNGFGTFIGLSSLNMKSYTNFETSTRFTQTVDGGGAITFGAGGLNLQTSTTATSSAINSWTVVQNIFTGSPLFSCSFQFDIIPNSAGVGFIGLGNPTTFSGSGATFLDHHIGFQFQYQSGEWRLYATQNNSNVEQFQLLTTVQADDIFDLILKVNGSSSVDYYYRKTDGGTGVTGALTKTTISSNVPTIAANEVLFAMSNKGTTRNINCFIRSASYER